MTQTSPFRSQIKIFLDGADRSAMVEMASHPMIQGFTTNPSLMKKAGVKDYRAFCKEILTQIQGKPVSFEVFADEFSEMKRQAKEIASWDIGDDNVYVKIPIMNSLGESSIPLIEELSSTGVKLNVTAIFTLQHVWNTCQALRKGVPSIVSVFAGRIADSGRDPLPLMHAAAELCSSISPQSELLWASTREAFNIVQAEMVGCKIITAPGDLIKKVSGFNRDLNDLSLDTVRTFKKDAETAAFSL